MKKIIALALAASMLSTSALAMEAYTKDKDGKFTVVNSGALTGVKNLANNQVKMGVEDFKILDKDGKIAPGASSLQTLDLPSFKFTADNFYINYRVTEGKSVVNKPEFDGEGNLVLTFNKKMVDEVKTNVPDLSIEFIEVKAKRTIKDLNDKELVHAGDRFRVELGNLNAKEGNFVVVQQKKADPVDASQFGLEKDVTDVVIKKDGTTKSDFESYNGNVQINGRVYAGDVVTFKTNETPKAEVLTALFQANPDADLDTHTFVVKGFRAPLTVKLTVDALGDVEAKDQVLYFMDETGKLTACNWKYNADEGVFEGKLPTGTTTIVNATKALTASPVASSNEDKKPADSKKPAVPETGLVVNVDAAIVK